MEWKFDGEILQIREMIPDQIIIDIKENCLKIWYKANIYLKLENLKLTNEEILKLIRYLLSIG